MDDSAKSLPKKKPPVFEPEEIDWSLAEQGAWINPETNTVRSCDVCRSGVGLWKLNLKKPHNPKEGPAFSCTECRRRYAKT